MSIDDIKSIQRLIGVEDDGVFGAKSRAALAQADKETIKKVQHILGVTEDGLFYAKSRAALESLIAGTRRAILPVPTAPTPMIGERHINDRGLELVKHFEALYLKAYQDEVGVWTIGWGHTGLTHRDGTVYPGRVITKEQAVELLRYDMGVFEKQVQQLVKVPLTDDQFSALVSFDFNTGGLGKSTLLRLLNSGDYDGAADQFLRWAKAGGKTLRGLLRRRKSERNLFLGKEDYMVYTV